jgi:DNA-binding transcriptional ArsR family regulator
VDKLAATRIGDGDVVGRIGPQAGTPASMRALNQRLVLERLRGQGEATRPQIAADTGLSKPTVGQALLDLEQHGLVRTTGRSLAGPGRAAVVYRAAPDAGHVVGVDIGWRAIRIAVADWEGSIVARLDEPNRCRSASALVAEKLAYVVAAVTAVLDPRLIVLGGGIGGKVDLLAPPMRAALAATVVPEIGAGQLGEDAVVAGPSRRRWGRPGSWCRSARLAPRSGWGLGERPVTPAGISLAARPAGQGERPVTRPPRASPKDRAT